VSVTCASLFSLIPPLLRISKPAYQAFRELGCVVRTVFLLQFLSDEKLREVIQSTTNKMEQFNAFCKWLLFGGEGKIADITPEDQEKRIKYNDLIANCVILNTTVELSEKLNELAGEGYVLTKDELAALSPYQTQHVKRFGNYELDLQTIPQPMTDDLLFEIIVSDTSLPLLETQPGTAG
jgi:Tn3 transposase DDE domain